ncbi:MULTISPECIES: hypothetical protein [unclassified Kitasatospora]|uniref:hypothetical protein n=1 Tax=unclassified Kitasatospora TaxID=2633591 RepID=UPI002E36A5B9|nr:hypothetical protein [Kitasatospora sp. NBC_01246]
MNVVHLPVPPRPHEAATTTVPYLAVEPSPDAAVQLRLAVDDPVGADPDEQLVFRLTTRQAEDLMHGLAWRLGWRCGRPLGAISTSPPCSDS